MNASEVKEALLRGEASLSALLHEYLGPQGTTEGKDATLSLLEDVLKDEKFTTIVEEASFDLCYGLLPLSASTDTDLGLRALRAATQLSNVMSAKEFVLIASEMLQTVKDKTVHRNIVLLLGPAMVKLNPSRRGVIWEDTIHTMVALLRNDLQSCLLERQAEDIAPFGAADDPMYITLVDHAIALSDEWRRHVTAEAPLSAELERQRGALLRLITALLAPLLAVGVDDGGSLNVPLEGADGEDPTGFYTRIDTLVACTAKIGLAGACRHIAPAPSPVPLSSPAVLAYLMCVHNIGDNLWPCIYSAAHQFTLLANQAVALMKSSLDTVTAKGLAVLFSLTTSLQPCSLDQFVEMRASVVNDQRWLYRDIGEALLEIMARCKHERQRQHAFAVLGGFLVALGLEQRLSVIEALLQNCPYPAISGLLVSRLQSEVFAAWRGDAQPRHAFQSTQTYTTVAPTFTLPPAASPAPSAPSTTRPPPSPFLNERVVRMVLPLLRIESMAGVHERVDTVVPTLNFLRFLMLKDADSSVIGIWNDDVQAVFKENLDHLRSSTKQAVTATKGDVRDINEKLSRAPPEKQVTTSHGAGQPPGMANAGRGLLNIDMMSLAQQDAPLADQKAEAELRLNTLYTIREVLSRVDEILKQRGKLAATDAMTQ